MVSISTAQAFLLCQEIGTELEELEKSKASYMKKNNEQASVIAKFNSEVQRCLVRIM